MGKTAGAVKFWVANGSYDGGITFSLFEWQDSIKSDNTGLRPLRKFYMAAHTGPVRAIAFNETADICASGGADETIRFFDLVALETDGVLSVGNQGAVALHFVALKSDKNKTGSGNGVVYLQCCTADGDVSLWNMQSKDVAHATKYKQRNSQGKIMKKRSPVAHVAVHPIDSSVSAVTYLDGSVQLWALDDKQAKAHLWKTESSVAGSFERIMRCAWACDGGVCVMQASRTTFVVQITSGEVLKIVPSSSDEKYTAVAALKDRMYLGTSSGTVYVYNLTSIEEDLSQVEAADDNEPHIFADLWIELCPPEAKKLKLIELMPVGKNALLVTGDLDGNVRYWKIGKSEKDCELLYTEASARALTSLTLMSIPMAKTAV